MFNRPLGHKKFTIMCKKNLNQEYLSAATAKTAMAAATGREIKRVMAFTLIAFQTIRPKATERISSSPTPR